MILSTQLWRIFRCSGSACYQTKYTSTQKQTDRERQTRYI